MTPNDSCIFTDQRLIQPISKTLPLTADGNKKRPIIGHYEVGKKGKDRQTDTSWNTRYNKFVSIKSLSSGNKCRVASNSHASYFSVSLAML